MIKGREMNGQGTMPYPPGAIVVGGQYGSEGKGAFIYEIGKDYGLHVRVGGPQAGHSIKLPTGKIFKLQTIPVGMALGQKSFIGMASVIDIAVLERELTWFWEEDLKVDLTIDYRATIMSTGAKEKEAQEGLTERLGSTGKGVGAARAERIMRTADTAGDYRELLEGMSGNMVEIRVGDTSKGIRFGMEKLGAACLVEAAQGIELSLFSSGNYPYVTSSEATPVGSFADLGLPLSMADQFEPVGVFRTHPIRVAGNSGPLANEITWEEVEARRGAPINESEKTTTVTRKLRRVGDWDAEAVARVVQEHDLQWACLSFLDYVFPEVTGETVFDRLPADAKRYVAARQEELGCPIKAVGTSFGTYAWKEAVV